MVLLKLDSKGKLTISEMETELSPYGVSRKEVRQAVSALWQASLLQEEGVLFAEDVACPPVDATLVAALSFSSRRRRVRLFHPSNRTVELVESVKQQLRSPIRR